MREKIQESKSGLSLVELLVAIGVSGILLSAIISMQAMSIRVQSQSNTLFQADLFRRNLTTLLNNRAAWSYTIAAGANSPNYSTNTPPFNVPPTSGSPGLNCLISPGSPCTFDGLPTGQPIGNGNPSSNKPNPINQVYDVVGNIYYDASNPSFGITPQGTACKTFNATTGSGNDECPLRFNITWQAVCSSTCINPAVKIQISPIYNPRTSSKAFAFNPGNYSAIFFQNQGAATAPSSPPLPIRFTKATANANISDGQKDQYCSNEYGPNYVVATYMDLTAGPTAGGPKPSNPFATVFGNSNYVSAQGTEPYFAIGSGSVVVAIACVYKYARVRFTRTAIAASQSDATKDSLCVSEFGSNYTTATTLDLISVLTGAIWPISSSRATVYGPSNYVQIGFGGSGNGPGILTGTGSLSLPIACISKD